MLHHSILMHDDVSELVYGIGLPSAKSCIDPVDMMEGEIKTSAWTVCAKAACFVEPIRCPI